METSYLAHHGVKGQKWGIRRYQDKNGSTTKLGRHRYYSEKSDIKKRVETTKAAKKAANKEYSKSFNKAYNYSNLHPISQFNKKSKHYAESDKRWYDVHDKVNKLDAANKAYKDAKRARVMKTRDIYADINTNKTSFKDRIMYNEATRRRAAQIMTDYKDVSYEQAMASAKKEAWRNTAIIGGGAYLAYKAGKKLI